MKTFHAQNLIPQLHSTVGGETGLALNPLWNKLSQQSIAIYDNYTTAAQ
jgi:hypothetical protein